MSYLLECIDEFSRLEKQTGFQAYDLIEELKSFDLENYHKVLDAGCGSGVLCRYLAQKFPEMDITGCDISDLRIKQARDYLRSSLPGEKIRFINACATDLKENFDLIICRYVIEHLATPEDFLFGLKNRLKPGGKLIIIDFDGLMLNLFSANNQLNDYLNKLKKYSGVDFFVGRKIPYYLSKAGFKKIDWQIQITAFSSKEDRFNEAELCRQRFHHARNSMIDLFSEEDYQQMISLYFNEIMNSNNPLFYNKFIVSCSV